MAWLTHLYPNDLSEQSLRMFPYLWYGSLRLALHLTESSSPREGVGAKTSSRCHYRPRRRGTQRHRQKRLLGSPRRREVRCALYYRFRSKPPYLSRGGRGPRLSAV